MKPLLFSGLFLLLIISACTTDHTTPVAENKKTDTLVLQDIDWDSAHRAGSVELIIPSEGSLLQGVFLKANGGGHHPTLILLHGFPGNEKNLDLAQVVRSRGWNVIFFNYRGSWGSQGTFSFKNCVQDVVNVVKFCGRYADSFAIDTTNI